MQCSACKADLATNIEYCPYCGQKISPQNGTTIFKKALDITTISCPYCKINLASGKCPMCNWSSVSGIPLHLLRHLQKSRSEEHGFGRLYY